MWCGGSALSESLVPEGVVRVHDVPRDQVAVQVRRAIVKPVAVRLGFPCAQFGTYCQYLSGWHFPPTRNPCEGEDGRPPRSGVSRPPCAWPFGCEFGRRRFTKSLPTAASILRHPGSERSRPSNRNEDDKPSHSHCCRMDSCWSVRARGCSQPRARSSSQHRRRHKRVDTRRHCSCHAVALHRGGRLEQG